MIAAAVRMLLAVALATGAARAADLPPALSAQDAASPAGAAESEDVRRIVARIIGSHDAGGLPFVVIDKVAARVFAFDSRGLPLGNAPALLGLARGDVSPPGIGDRALADIAPAERITPSGRFLASHGNDLGTKDIVWIDYAAAISLHRVVPGKPAEARARRLATPSVLDNRISYGCINVPAAFYDRVIWPMFSNSDGIVYILPETAPAETLFIAADETNQGF